MIPLKLAAARVGLVTERPYLAAAVWGVHLVPEAIGTFAVDDKWRLYYDPECVESWTVSQLQTVLCHEINHLLRDHAERAKAKGVDSSNAKAWNAAADAEINPRIVDEGGEFPFEQVMPATLLCETGLLAEQMFDRMPRDRHGKEGCNCGSGATSVPLDHELPGGSPDVGSTSTVEAGLIRRQVAKAVREAGAEAGEWARWADAILAPVVNWRRELSARIRASVGRVSGVQDYSYRRPSRRQAAVPGVVLPSMFRPKPRVGVVVDTSGSMSNDDLQAALSETEGVLRQVGADSVKVYSCDITAHKAKRVNTASKLVLVGGGGTNIVAGIEAAISGRADVVVVLTDGFTPWPRSPTRVPCVAVLTQANSPAPPAWVRSMRVL